MKHVLKHADDETSSSMTTTQHSSQINIAPVLTAAIRDPSHLPLPTKYPLPASKPFNSLVLVLQSNYHRDGQAVFPTETSQHRTNSANKEHHKNVT